MGVLARLAATITGLDLADPDPDPIVAAGPSQAEQDFGGGFPRVAGAPILDGLLLAVAGGGLYSREQALTVPAIARGRDLIVGLLSTLPFRFYRESRDPTADRVPVEAPTWAARPDPMKPRGWTVGGLADDLLFHGVGYWLVLERFADSGFPARFRWMPRDEVAVGMDGLVRWAPGPRSGFARPGSDLDPVTVPYADVVEFVSPLVPVLDTGSRTITTAVALDEAARRFASVEMPAGWLRQTGGEPLTPDEMTAEAARFAAARKANTVAMLNEFVEWNESTMDPDRLQLTASRNHQAIEAGRLMNVPAALLDAEVSSMTYSNQRDAMVALWWFGVFPIADAIGQVLSGPNVTPNLTVVEVDPGRVLDAPAFADTARTSDAPDRPRPGGSDDAD